MRWMPGFWKSLPDRKLSWTVSAPRSWTREQWNYINGNAQWVWWLCTPAANSVYFLQTWPDVAGAKSFSSFFTKSQIPDILYTEKCKIMMCDACGCRNMYSVCIESRKEYTSSRAVETASAAVECGKTCCATPSQGWKTGALSLGQGLLCQSLQRQI